MIKDDTSEILSKHMTSLGQFGVRIEGEFAELERVYANRQMHSRHYEGEMPHDAIAAFRCVQKAVSSELDGTISGTNDVRFISQ